MQYAVRQIDAYRYDGVWTWNDSVEIGRVDLPEDASHRRVLAALRRAGVLTESSKGRLRVEDVCDDAYEVQDASTHEPILYLQAIE